MLPVPKAKADRPIPVGSSPHLHSRQSASRIMWATVATLSPIALVSFIFFGLNALRIYAVSIGAGLFFEYAFDLLAGQKSKIRDGSTVLCCLLFSFLMPSLVPNGLIVLGVFISVIVGKELFGGLGQNLFHPALVGYAVLMSLIPELTPVQRQPISVLNFFWWNASPILGTGSAFLILICGLFLAAKKFVRWENALFYLLSSFLCLYGLGCTGLFELIPFLLFMATLFITDPASSPITKEGRILFSTAAGVLTAAFFTWMDLYQAAVAAVLISSSLVPLMDRMIYSLSRS